MSALQLLPIRCIRNNQTSQASRAQVRIVFPLSEDDERKPLITNDKISTHADGTCRRDADVAFLRHHKTRGVDNEKTAKKIFLTSSQ
jgi:hypothetical protein